MSKILFIRNSIIDIFWPNECTICQCDLTHMERFYCLTCLHELPFLERHPSALEQIQKILWGRTEVDKIFALLNFQKNNNTQKILHEIKYHGKSRLAEHMGQLMSNMIPANHTIDYIIPIPLHPKKKRKRGYNQSLLLAKGISQKLNIPILNDTVKRISGNASQTQFSKYDRWQNVRSIFTVKNAEFVENKHLLIVDDVLTTGATIESCILELKRSVNCKISVATLATRI